MSELDKALTRLAIGTKFSEVLDEYDLKVVPSKNPNREKIDFEVRDDNGHVCATVWGSHPINDIQIECEHPFVEYDDDETVGECPLCGATCNWHYEPDGEGHSERVPHDWMYPEKIGGNIGVLLELLGENA